VHFSTAEFDPDQVLAILRRHKVRYVSLSAKQLLDANRSQVKFYIKIPNNLPLKPFFKDISHLQNVSEVYLGQDA
jgi:predicted acetyltransferase